MGQPAMLNGVVKGVLSGDTLLIMGLPPPACTLGAVHDAKCMCSRTPVAQALMQAKAHLQRSKYH